MPARRLVHLAAASATLIAACRAPASTSIAADSAAVHAALEDIIAKTAIMTTRGDAGPWLATLTEDAVRYGSNSQPPHRGREAIRAAAMAMGGPPDMVDMDSHEAIESLRVAGGLAVASGSWAFKGRNKGDSTLALANGYWLVALRREPDGVWRMSHDMFTQASATNPTPP